MPTNQGNIDKAWEHYARSSQNQKAAGLASLENTLIGAVLPVHPHRLKPHQQDWPLLSMLLKYYLPQNEKDLILKETLLAYAQEEKGSFTDWQLMERLLLGLPQTSLETALSPEQWRITPWFHFNPDLAKNLMGCFSEHPEQTIQEALFFPFSQRRPVLNEETALFAFPHAYGKTKSPITSQPLTNANRLAAIQSTITAINQSPQQGLLIKRLDVLLGTPTAKAKAQAAQYFFSPWSTLKRQLYWVTLSAVQVIENQRLKNPDISERYQYDQLDSLLFHVLGIMCDVFPEIRGFPRSFLKTMREEKLTPLALLHFVYQGCQTDDFPFAVDTLHLLPDADETLQAYTLTSIESIALAYEKSQYRARAWSFFTQYPDQIPYFQNLFSLSADSLESLIDQMAEAPSLLGWQSPGRALMESTTDERIHQQLLKHGAYYARSSETADWSRLKNTLTVYAPQSYQDERFRQQMMTYSDLKNHEDSRWSALMRALFLAKETKTTFFEQAYQEAVKTKKDYRWEPRLLTMARECQNFSSHTLHDFFSTLGHFEQTFALRSRFLPESPDIAQFIPAPETTFCLKSDSVGDMAENTIYLSLQGEMIFYETTLTTAPVKLGTKSRFFYGDSLTQLSDTVKDYFLEKISENGHCIPSNRLRYWFNQLTSQ